MSEAVSNNHLQIVFFFPWFTGALRCVWVRLVYIILDTTTNFTVAFTARHTRCT